MRDYIDVNGASGSSYRFMRIRDGRPLSPMGGNFLYGRFTGDRFELIFAGEVQNLLQEARGRWGEAQERFQVSELYTRLNISERVRQLELADVVQAHAPPMNVASELKASESSTGSGRRDPNPESGSTLSNRRSGGPA